jgi:hypothetical protein
MGLVLGLEATLRAVDMNEDQMARARGYLKTTETPARKVRVLFAENETVVFTRKYVKHTLLSKKEYGQGQGAIVTNIHKGPLGGITHVDIRLPEGEFVCEVPIDFFKA